MGVTDGSGAAASGGLWASARWINPPESAHLEHDELVVTARAGSELWRTTAYGFIHNDGHAPLAPLPTPGSVEVSFRAELGELYDQAGILLRIDDRTWVKSGIEQTDGCWHLAAVATREVSDWSLAPVPDGSAASSSARRTPASTRRRRRARRACGRRAQ